MKLCNFKQTYAAVSTVHSKLLLIYSWVTLMTTCMSVESEINILGPVRLRRFHYYKTHLEHGVPDD